MAICFVALAILAIFYAGALTGSTSRASRSIRRGGWFTEGIPGIFFALPFAIWFFLAIEELPLAAEESADPKRDIPRGTIYGLLTLVVTGFLVLFLSGHVAGLGRELSESGEPLLDGLTRRSSATARRRRLLGLAAVAGLVASFHTIIFAYGRNIYSLSRAGYYPHPLSVTHGTRHTPHVALVLGAVIGWIAAYILYEWGTGTVGAALLSMAVFGAVISYFMQSVAFVSAPAGSCGHRASVPEPVGVGVRSSPPRSR